MELLFWRHATASQKLKGMCTLYLRITVNGTREEIGSTSIKISSDTWSESTQRINYHEPLSNFKNEQLALTETRLWAIYNELLRRGQGITAERIKREYALPMALTYMSAFDSFKKQYDANPKIEESSRKTLKNVRQLIVRYLIENKMLDILAEEFDFDTMNGYKRWCDGQNYAESYITRTSRSIVAITKFAKQKKWISFDPLEGYLVGRETIAKPEYLDSVQLKIWKNHTFMHPSAQEVADLFVLYSRTGFHYQDLIQVIRDPDKFVMTGIDGKQWIYKPRQKTGTEAKVPFSKFPEIKVIIDKYGGWANVPTYSNSKMNGWLKLCAAEVNLKLIPAQRIYGELSVKHGRSSFCDYCLNELGISKEALLTMMGRVSAAELERYVRGDERGVITAFRISDAALAS